MTVDTTPVACCAPITGAEVSDDEAKAAAQLFKALADVHRVKIINLLANADGPVCVCDITPELDVAQPTASFHLRKLTEAGLLRREARGKWAYYSIDPSALKTLKRTVGGRR